MKKILKNFLIAVGSVIAFLYIAFLLVPPIFNAFYDLDKHKEDIQKVVKETTKLNLEYSRIKLFTTPLLSAGISIQDVNITLDDKSTLFNSAKIKGGIALPSLLTLTVKTSKTSVENPYINLEIVNDEQYKIIKIVEDIINENNAKPKTQPTKEEEFVNKIVEKIKIKIPAIKITNYEAIVKDLKSSHNLSVKGEKLIVGYNSKKNNFKLKTDAKLFSDKNENITAKINIKSSLPPVVPSKETVDPDEKIAIPFVNIVKIYQTYDLKTNIDTRLRVILGKKGLSAFGYLNVDDINLKLSDIRLPNSYFHSKFHGKTIKYDTNLYATKDEKLSLVGKLNYSKKPRLKTTIYSEKIQFANLVSLLRGLLDSLNIKNELAQIKTTGYLSANATIKTNFKKLKSQGSIIVKNGSFINPKYNIGIKDIVANLILDNNILNIENTQLTINNSKLTAKGTIDNKSKADIKFDVDDLSLTELYNAFAPKELKNAFKLNSAKLSAHANINGKLDNLDATLNTKLKNLNISDTKNTLLITNKELGIDFNVNPSLIKGVIVNNDFDFNMPQIKTTGKIENVEIDLDDKNITIKPFDFIYNKLSKINVRGEILNYTSNPIIDIFADGKIATQDINQTLGKEISYYIPSVGALPLKVSAKGDSKAQEILAQIYANSQNHFSPISFNSLNNGGTIAQADIKVEGSKIKVKNSGIFKAQNNFSDSLENNMLNAIKIADLTAILDNGHINLFRISIPEEQQGKIGIFKNSSFKTKGKIVLTGRPDDLSFDGDYKIHNIDIPELYLKAGEINLNFIPSGLNLKTKDIDINGSKINASLKADLKPAKVFKISNIDVKSPLINVDSAMKTLDAAFKYMPPANPSAKPAQVADIPLVADGEFDIKKLTTGQMLISNIKGDLGIANNDLLINNLDCNAFKGKVNGDIKMNLLSSLLTIKLNGKNLDSDEAASKAANLKNTISGDLKFSTDISLKGATYEEQVKSLKGNVDFELKDGQFGPFAKLENFFLAENIRENPFFQNTIGVILTPITTIDSSHYEKLNGSVSFNKGVVKLNSIKSQGDILCVLVDGNMNLLTNKIDSYVRVRLASAVSDLLGPIAMANPVNLVKNTPGLNIATAKLFSVFSEVVTEEEYKKIPDFSKNHTDENATKFQIILNGDVTKPLTIVKSFKWLALQEDMDKAKTFSTSFVAEQEELLKQELMNKLQAEYEANNKVLVGVEKLLHIDTTAPEVKKMLEEEAQKAKEAASQKAKEEVDKKAQEIKKEIDKKTEKIKVQKEEVKKQAEDKKQELEQKVQNVIDAKKLEQEQKLLDAQEKLKSKLQEKLKFPTVQGAI